MRTVENILDDIMAVIRPLIVEAFEAGRKSGADDMRAALDAFLHHPVVHDGMIAATETPDAVIIEGRAPPGSVKPAIIRVS